MTIRRPSKIPSAEKVAEHFVGYVCTNKAESRHVRRVLGWLGYVVGGIDRIASEWGFLNRRQFWFAASGRTYKVRFNHGIGSRGGLQIVEFSGRADIRVVAEVSNYAEAEAFYHEVSIGMFEAEAA